MNEPKTFAVWGKTVLEWDEEWDPRVVLGELAWFLDDARVERFKLRVMRRSKYWSSPRLTGKNVVVVTDVPHLYSRRAVEEAFGGWHVERVVDGFLLVRLEAFLDVLEVLKVVERLPEGVLLVQAGGAQKAGLTVA
jgi:hypothetical protein